MDEIPKQLRTEITGLSRAIVERFQAAASDALASQKRLLEFAQPTLALNVVIQGIFNKSIRPIIQMVENPLVSAPFLVVDKTRPDDQRMEAINRLAGHKAFSRRALFHPSRWAALADGFSAYCTEQKLTAEQAWGEIVRPALIIALAEADRKARNKPLIEFWRTARREVRREIEKTILDGKTLDRRGEVELPEDENALPDWIDFEPEGELGEREAELFRRVAGLLTLRELQALLDHPTDKASLMARKRAMDKIHKAGLDALVSTAQTLKQD